MTEDLLDRLQAIDPAASAESDADARDTLIWERLQAQTERPARSRRRLLVPVLAAGLLALLALSLGLGRGGGRHDFDAAAKTYEALRHEAGVYHFAADFTLTERPAGVAQSTMGPPFRFPSVAGTHPDRTRYQEVWITPGGRSVRWLAYRGPRGGLVSAFAFRQTPARGPAIKRPGARPLPSGCPNSEPPPSLPPSDPATGFRQSYCLGFVRSAGGAVLNGRRVWRLVSRPSRHGAWQEWLVDRDSWLPVQYRYVDHNQQAGVPYTARLTVRFRKFEVLPIDSRTRALLRLTPAERRFCLAAGRRELARMRKALGRRHYLSAVRVVQRHQSCR